MNQLTDPPHCHAHLPTYDLPCGPPHVLLPGVTASLPPPSSVLVTACNHGNSTVKHLLSWQHYKPCYYPLPWQDHNPCNHGNSEGEQVQGTGWYCMCSPKAPPISAPLVGMLTLTMPQSEPFGLHMEVAEKAVLGCCEL